MQPNAPGQYTQPPMAPNPYASFSQMQAAPVPPPKKGGSLLIPFIICTVLLVSALGLFFWAYMGMQDYKNNADKKITAAVATARKEEAITKEKQFSEEAKKPLDTYTAPSTFGSVSVQYPKTWSAYVTESANGNTLIDGYFHPGYVPGVQSNTAYALRLQVLNRSFAEEQKQFDALVKAGKVKVSAYRAPKMPGVTGARVDGEIKNGKQSSMVLLPLRDKTIKISTETSDFGKDFDENVMANLTFVP